MILDILKNNVSKSLLYILFFAGILKLSGMLLTWFWNNYMVYSFEVEYITFLESVGMLAFFYLVYSGVKFGFATITNQINPKIISKPGKLPQSQTCESIKEKNDYQFANKLSPDEKERLKQAIAKCCGFHHDPIKLESTPKIKIPKVNNIQ